MEDLIVKLRERLTQGLKRSASPNPGVVFGFPGQGSQFSGMAKALADRFSGFRDIIVEHASEGESLSGFPLLGLMLGTDEGDVDIDNSQVAQICIFVYQCALAKWLTGLGIKADAVCGHSLGEFAAAGWSSSYCSLF
jgi:acyl transferase domain-containing protein